MQHSSYSQINTVIESFNWPKFRSSIHDSPPGIKSILRVICFEKPMNGCSNLSIGLQRANTMLRHSNRAEIAAFH